MPTLTSSRCHECSEGPIDLTVTLQSHSPPLDCGRKVGPRDKFLITILHSVKNPVHFSLWPTDTALPKLENTPPLPQQFVSVPEISPYVLVEFQDPEIFTGLGIRGISATGVPVPEAAMNENANPIA